MTTLPYDTVDLTAFWHCEDARLSKRTVIQLLDEYSTTEHKETYRALEYWLEWLAEVFSTVHLTRGVEQYLSHIEQKRTENPIFHALTCKWLQAVKESSGTKNGFCDFFGETYEAYYQSRGKSSALGQFFTPEGLCKCMADIVGAEPINGRSHDISFCDCACGSARTVLAGISSYRQRHPEDDRLLWAMCGDIDRTSIYMAALNLMAHGLQGIVVQQDALLMSRPTMAFLVNPCNVPLPTGYLSITRLQTDEELAPFFRTDNHDGREHWVFTSQYFEVAAHQREELLTALRVRQMSNIFRELLSPTSTRKERP